MQPTAVSSLQVILKEEVKCDIACYAIWYTFRVVRSSGYWPSYWWPQKFHRHPVGGDRFSRQSPPRFIGSLFLSCYSYSGTWTLQNFYIQNISWKVMVPWFGQKQNLHKRTQMFHTNITTNTTKMNFTFSTMKMSLHKEIITPINFVSPGWLIKYES